MINWLNDIAPTEPFMASIFNYYLSDDLEGYEEMDKKTIELAKESSGFLGYESFKHNGRGSFISYWRDQETIKNWSKNPIHIQAKKQGKRWYKYYHSMICEVNRYHQHPIEKL